MWWVILNFSYWPPLKKALIILIFTCASQSVVSQSIRDSLRKVYDAAVSPLAKGQVLANYITSLKGTSPEQLSILLPLNAYFTNKKDETGLRPAGACL
jgi:hypothetical protein